MNKIPFVVALVADPVDQLYAQASDSAIQILTERIAYMLPDTQVVLLSLLNNHHEVALAKVAWRGGAQVWHLSAADADTPVWMEFVSKQLDLPLAFAAASGEDLGREEFPLAWLVAHCHLLLAVSNVADGSRAHTAHQFRAHSIPPELGGKRGVFFAAETGASLLLRAGEALDLATVERKIEFPAGRCFESWVPQLRELNRANKGLAQLDGKVCARSMWDMPLDPTDLKTTQTFQQIDTLSRRHQTMVTILHSLILTTGLGAVLLLQWMGDHIRTLPLADLYAIAFMLIGTGHIWVRKWESNDQYADYRALAEGLRVQYYWRKAGIRDAPAEYFLHKHQQRLGWVRDALKLFHLASPASQPDQKFCMDFWVKKQADYHRGSARRNGLRSIYLSRTVWALYSISLLFTFVSFFLQMTSVRSGGLG